MDSGDRRGYMLAINIFPGSNRNRFLILRSGCICDEIFRPS